MGLLAACAIAVAVAAALGCLLRAWREHGRARVAWLLLAAAALIDAGYASAAADGGLDLWPGWTAAHLVAAACAGVALVRLSTPIPGSVDPLPPGLLGSRGRLAVETGAAALGLMLILWQLVLPEVLASAGTVRDVDAMAGALIDVGAACVVVWVLGRARQPAVTPFRSLGAASIGVGLRAAGSALLVVGLGESVLAQSAGLVLLVVAGALLFAGARRPSGDADSGRDDERRERAAVLAPVAPLVVAGALWIWLGISGVPLTPVATALGVCMVLVLLASAVLWRLDSLRIARLLEQRVHERTVQLGTREKWFRALVQNSSDIVVVIDEDGRVRYVTPSIEHLLGQTPEDLLGTCLYGALATAEAAALEQQVAWAGRRAASGDIGGRTLELTVTDAEGVGRRTEVHVNSLLADPDVRGVVLTLRDVSEQREMQEQLTRQAYSDALTGLANRMFFTMMVEQQLAGARAGTVAVLFLDLDGFKAVNDAQGHAVGDELLVLVAQRLRGCVRPEDLIARLGGDEFAIVVVDDDAERSALGVAQRSRQVLASDFRVGGRAVALGASIGISVNDDGSETADDLLRNADLAMYRAKAMARSSFVRFEAQMHEALMARVEAEKDLRLAAAAGDLRLHYQPLVDLKTGRITGAEALMRWQHPTRGLLPPDEFIGLAEETGQIGELGSWALAQAAQQAAAWQRFAPDGTVFRMSVNVSAHQLTSGLPRLVRQHLVAAGIPASALTLEVTESVLLERTDDVTSILRRLKELGVRLALDDFGTGYSSLSYLTRLPVDVLKIDRAFVEALGSASEDAELARTIVHLGRTLGLVTVAEGIETTAQRDQLADLGCQVGQGYLFSPPLPAAELEAVLRTGVALPVA